MIELIDDKPDLNVPAAEYARLLGYPRHYVLDGRALELANWARAWYAEHGRPWIYARSAERLDVEDGGVIIDGQSFAASPLGQKLQEAEAEGVVLVAVSAGVEAETEAARAWQNEKPDEYFFLETYASAVVEHLTTMAGARLCDWADGQAMAVLPHYSPGYPGWDVVEQGRLLSLVKHGSQRATAPDRLNVLDSGMMQPKKSLLAVFGITRRTERVTRLSDLSPCGNCCYAGCRFRRAAYQGPSPFRPLEISVPQRGQLQDVQEPLTLSGQYGVNRKALERWARDRLSITDGVDGALEANFRYEGTTCTNLGRSLAFNYTIRLGTRREGYPIKFQSCAPNVGDEGHRHMCRFLDEGDRLLDAIANDRPLAGAPLDEILNWNRPACAAGCYCDDDSRQHKWGLVLETLHYAIARRERLSTPPTKDVTIR